MQWSDGFSGQNLISKSIKNSGNVCCGPMSPDLSPFRIIICYIYIALFCKALYMEGGGGDLFKHHQCAASTWMILRQKAHHTPAYWWREERVMKLIGVWGWLRGHDGQRPVGKFGQDTGVTPVLFFKGHPGIFNDHRESGPRFNVSTEGRCFLQYSVHGTTLGR